MKHRGYGMSICTCCLCSTQFTRVVTPGTCFAELAVCWLCKGLDWPRLCSHQKAAAGHSLTRAEVLLYASESDSLLASLCMCDWLEATIWTHRIVNRPSSGTAYIGWPHKQGKAICHVANALCMVLGWSSTCKAAMFQASCVAQTAQACTSR